jgi:hypothetical protein
VEAAAINAAATRSFRVRVAIFLSFDKARRIDALPVQALDVSASFHGDAAMSRVHYELQ